MVRNETVPRGRGELIAGKVQGGTHDQQPGPVCRKQKRQHKNGKPRQGLSSRAHANERFPVGKPPKQLDRGQLGAGANQLGKGGQDTQLKRAGLKQEGKGGKILFAAALRDGLTSPVTKAVSAAWFSEVLFDGLQKVHLPDSWLKRLCSTYHRRLASDTK